MRNIKGKMGWPGPRPAGKKMNFFAEEPMGQVTCKIRSKKSHLKKLLKNLSKKMGGEMCWKKMREMVLGKKPRLEGKSVK